MIRRTSIILLLMSSFIASGSASAADMTPWLFEIKGGLFEPDLPLYKEFYGDDRNGYFAAAFGYQFKRWLELGGELGYSRDKGAGLQPGNVQLGGAVKYTLVPAHLYVNLLGKASHDQLFVPYAGGGLTTAYYKQDIASQPNRDGRTDLGYNARAGVQLLLNRLDRRTSDRISPNGEFQSYLFIEGQWFSTEIDGTELGGITYLIGVRMEWGSGAR
ncbi:MAG: outer membrane beta-barrel protein [Gammaproteobacteria bacterium]